MRKLIMALALSFSLASLASAATYLEDFEGYPDGSDGSPSWRTTSIFWEVREGSLIGTDLDRSFAIFRKAPPGREIAVEATLEIKKVLGKGWKVAGVSIYLDPMNYWHLAFVEAPDDQGRGHFVELCEMLEGNWLAQSQPSTRLKPLEMEGVDLKWRFGHPYRLRIELMADRIVGTVSELDGTVLSRISFGLEGRAVMEGWAALDNGGFESSFDDVSVRVIKEASIPVEVRRGMIPEIRIERFEGVRGKATGFFHVEKVDGKHWLITPDGYGFLMIGTDHVNFNAHWCEKLGYAPYHRKMEDRYGTEEKWAEDVTKMLLSWGFNSLGAGHSRSTRYRGLAHTEFLGLGTRFASYDDIVPKVHWTGFPNVFNPKFKDFCEKVAEEVCAQAREDQWLIGYFIDNELEWYGKSFREWGIFEEAMKKPPNHEAKKALVRMLKERHGDIASFNSSWGTNFKDFEELLEIREPLVPATDRARDDAMAFVKLCADLYFSISANSIRKYDPNHLILGSRFAGAAPDCVWEAAGRYCDVVTVNIYPRVDMERGEAIGVEELLTKWHSLCGKPLIITEWSFPALDSGLPCKNGAGMRVDTQTQRSYCSAIMQELFFRTPFVVGSDFFMWVDEPELGISSTFPEDSNYGLVNENNEPYRLLTEMFSRINREAYRIHSGELRRSSTIEELRAKVLEEIRIVGRMPEGGGKVYIRRTDKGFEIDNGVLHILKEEEDGDTFDRIELRGITVGRFTQLIWQQVPENLWVSPRKVELIKEEHLDDGSLAIEVVASYKRGGSGEGPRSFRTSYLFIIPPNTSWFASKCLWVENTDEEPWKLAGYYHYTRSAIGGDPGDDEVGGPGVPNYWMRFGAWFDPKLSIYFGVIPDQAGDIDVHFWKDSGGGQHPDAVRRIGIELGKGKRYEGDEPIAFVFASEGGRGERPWMEILAQARIWMERRSTR